MHRAALVALLLVGCKCNDKPATKPQVASGSASGDAATAVKKLIDDATLVAKFAELRDDRALGCLIERTEKPNTTSEVLSAVAEYSPSPVLVRVVGFALVERAKPEGDSLELDAIAEAVHAIGPFGDLDGLKTLFQRVDQIDGVEPRWLDDDESYRARIARDLPKTIRTRGQLAWVAQTAMAGQQTLAEEIYEKEVQPDDRRASPDHVAALAALGREAKVRELIATAPEKQRAQLVDTWLVTTARAKKPVGDVVSEMAREIERDPTTPYPTPETLRAVARADAAAGLRLRKAETAVWTPEYLEKHPGAVEWMYVQVLESGTDAERTEIEPRVPAGVKTRELTLRTGPLDEALAFALREKYPDRALTRVWIRAMLEEPAFLATLADKVCKSPPPKVVTPTPAAPGLKLVVTEKVRAQQAECQRKAVLVRLVKDNAILEEEIFEGACSGACTAAEKRAGKKMLAEIEARIAKGESSESELDYNFTECQYSGHAVGRTERIGEREVAIMESIAIGPHDVPQTSFQLAFEVCGDLFTSSLFGGRYAGGWRIEDLKVEASPDAKEIRVRAESESWRGFVYRAILPVCPGAPIEKINASDF